MTGIIFGFFFRRGFRFTISLNIFICRVQQFIDLPRGPFGFISQILGIPPQTAELIPHLFSTGHKGLNSCLDFAGHGCRVFQKVYATGKQNDDQENDGQLDEFP